MTAAVLPEPPLTLREVAQYLSITEDVARDLLRKRKLQGFKAGGQWRVPPAAITEYVIAQLAKR
jgi:excisionase family DNA binding protein